VTLTIDGQMISGTSACNHYDARATIEGESFVLVGVPGSTLMGCGGPRLTAEERYLHALEGVSTIRRDGDDLVLGGDGVSLRFEVVPPPEPVPLENTTWHLNGLTYGRGPDGIVSFGEPGTLQLRDDGTFTATTGCGKLTGKWSENNGTWTTSILDRDGRCDNHVQEQEDHVLDVLKGFTVEHEVRQLDLEQVDGDLGLSYTADDPADR
jgi:heat shock protein HslJ